MEIPNREENWEEPTTGIDINGHEEELSVHNNNKFLIDLKEKLLEIYGYDFKKQYSQQIQKAFDGLEKSEKNVLVYIQSDTSSVFFDEQRTDVVIEPLHPFQGLISRSHVLFKTVPPYDGNQSTGISYYIAAYSALGRNLSYMLLNQTKENLFIADYEASNELASEMHDLIIEELYRRERSND